MATHFIFKNCNQSPKEIMRHTKKNLSTFYMTSSPIGALPKKALSDQPSLQERKLRILVDRQCGICSGKLIWVTLTQLSFSALSFGSRERQSEFQVGGLLLRHFPPPILFRPNALSPRPLQLSVFSAATTTRCSCWFECLKFCLLPEARKQHWLEMALLIKFNKD